MSPDQLAYVDGKIGESAFAINLIAGPPEPVREVLISFQDAINPRVRADGLFRPPPSSLHLSVFQLVWVRSAESGKRRTWSVCCDQVLAELDAVTRTAREILLNSPSIHAEQSAVIVKFSTSNALEALRDQVAVIASKAELNWNRPSIQHVSIFRYRRAINLSEVAAACAGIEVPDFTWPVRGLMVVRENVYPSLDFDVIRGYELMGSMNGLS